MIFRDAKGRIVAAKDRYSKKVKTVQAVRGGRYVNIIEDGDVTPKKLVDLVSREEYEAMPVVYGKSEMAVTKATKYRAWGLAGAVTKQRGVKGKLLKLDIGLIVGKKKKSITVFFQPKKYASNSKNQTALWSTIVRTLGLENVSEYDKLPNRIFQDRRGTKKGKITGIKVSRVI